MPKIEKMKSGNYRIRVYIGKDSEGKRHWKVFTHPDKKVLKRIAAEYEDNHRECVPYDIFEKCAESYIRMKRPVLSPQTIKTYEDTLELLRNKFSWVCGMNIDNIDKTHVQRLVNALVSDDKSPKYVRNIYGFMSAVFKQNGVKIPEATLPEKRQSDLYEPDTDEIKRIIQLSKGTVLEVPILLGIHGLRRGEICALHYPEDFDGNIVHVKRNMVYLGRGQKIEKTPKNIQSDRFVPLTQEVVDLIEKQGYVVRCVPQTLTGSFRKFLIRNNLPHMRFHDLRHYFASYLHDKGFSDAEIMSLGGWKTDHVMKRVYRHAIKGKTNDKIKEVMKELI